MVLNNIKLPATQGFVNRLVLFLGVWGGQVEQLTRQHHFALIVSQHFRTFCSNSCFDKWHCHDLLLLCPECVTVQAEFLSSNRKRTRDKKLFELKAKNYCKRISCDTFMLTLLLISICILCLHVAAQCQLRSFDDKRKKCQL